MSTAARLRIAGAVALMTLALAGCSTARTAGQPHVGFGGVAGGTAVTASSSGPATSNQVTTGVGSTSTTGGAAGTPADEPCDDIVIGDPWIVFESPLGDGDELTVGDRGWLRTSSGADEIIVSGDQDAVRLTDETAATTIECGTVTSTARWVEVTGLSVGTVGLTLPGWDGAIRVTIVPR